MSFFALTTALSVDALAQDGLTQIDSLMPEVYTYARTRVRA